MSNKYSSTRTWMQTTKTVPSFPIHHSLCVCVCVCVSMTSWHMHISKLLYITGQGEKGRGYGEVRCVFCVTGGSSSIWFSLVCAGKRREDVGLFDVSRVQVRSFYTWAA